LDKGKEERKMSEYEIKEEIKKIFGKDNPSIDEVRSFSQKISEDTLRHFDNQLKSRWIGKDKRMYFRTFRAIWELLGHNQDTMYGMLEEIDDLQKTVIFLGRKVESSQGRTKELSDALSKMKESTEQKLATSYAALVRLDQLLKGEVDSNQQSKPQKNKDNSGGYRV
jgi:hypothetical protein